MNKLKQLMKERTFLGLATVVLTCAMVLCPRLTYGEILSVTITTGSNWPIGTIGAGITDYTSGDAWVVTGSPDGYENINIKVEDATSPTPANFWTASTTGSNGLNIFVLREDDAGGKLIKSTDVILTNIAKEPATYPFDLWFKAPASGSDADVQHTLTVTLTAANWARCPTDAYDDGTNCWYLGELGESCNTVCANYGETSVEGFDTTTCTIMKTWYPSCNCQWCNVAATACPLVQIPPYTNYCMKMDPAATWSKYDIPSTNKRRLCKCQ